MEKVGMYYNMFYLVHPDINIYFCRKHRKCKYKKTRPISDGFRKNNVNYWAFREIRSIIPHL